MFTLGCTTQPRTTIQADRLIDNLAATNDKFRSDVAVESYEALTLGGIDVIDALVRYSKDNRDAWPCFHGSYRGRCTVGRVCWDILNYLMYGDRPKAYRHSIFDDYSTQEWWQARRGRSLRTLMIEARKYAIEKVKREYPVGDPWREECLNYYRRELEEAQRNKNS